ncbi:MAG: ATP-binding protein, partial [Promethearchaeota archaeon]
KSLANQIHDWYKLDFLALIETHITGIFDLVDHLHENYKQMNLKKQDINTILVELHHEMELKIAQDKVCAKQDAFTLQLLILIVTFVVTPSITLITSIVQRCLLKKLYKNLFNNVTNGVALYDAKNDGKDFIIKDFNISGERIECVKKEDIIGKSVLKIFPGVKDLGLFEVFQRVWKTGKSEYHPTSYYQDKRIQGWRENYVYKLPNGQIVAIYNDTTDKKLAKLLIKELEEKYRILVQSSSASIILLNLKGEIIDCNDRTKDLFSICKSELIGKKFQNLVIFKDISQWTEKEFMEIIKKELEEPRIFSFINKDGKFYFLKSTFSLLKMEKKNYIQVISYDITSQKKAEILIEKQLKKLRELDQIKNDLIQRIAHELRTPLTSIYSGSEFLLNHCREKIDIRTQKFLKIINKGGYRLKELVDNLLLTFNIESNSLKLEFQDSNIIPIIEESIKSIAHIASKRKILIYKKFHDNLYLDMDNSKIKKVISNLILNAIQNTLKNGSVYISTIKNGNFIEIIIEDTGVGFTEREKKMIFKKFGKIERYGNGMNIDTEGPGLGLYIANKITEMHGGKIWVKSKGRNKGSTFIVRLPIKQ